MLVFYAILLVFSFLCHIVKAEQFDITISIQQVAWRQRRRSGSLRGAEDVLPGEHPRRIRKERRRERRRERWKKRRRRKRMWPRVID